MNSKKLLSPKAGILNQARLRPHITGLRPSAIEGNIINTLIRLKNSGLAEGSLRTISNNLKLLGKNCNLDDSEAVKQFIANKKCDDSYKASLVKAYNYYTVINGIQWIKPKYKPERKIPKIPTTEAINKIISRASRKYATIFKILMETGVMPYELSNVTLRDIDLEKGTLAVQGFKGHASRIFKLKSETIAMLKEYLAKHGFNDKPFPKADYMGKMWRRWRNNLAENTSKITIVIEMNTTCAFISFNGMSILDLYTYNVTDGRPVLRYDRGFNIMMNQITISNAYFLYPYFRIEIPLRVLISNETISMEV